MKYIISCLLLCSFGYYTVNAQSTTVKYRFAFYNVENLFDTKDDPGRKDESFTPDGRLKWTDTRYQRKLNQLTQVIAGMEFPSVLGLAEVENRRVLNDFVNKISEKENVNYAFVHAESPDVRGIDVALLYDKDVWTLDLMDSIRVTFPKWLEPEAYTSRDILMVRLENKDKEAITFFVNHWPSRRGGVEQSAPRRQWVATHLRQAVEAIRADDPFQKIVVMGDLNDEPLNASVRQVLGVMPVAADSMMLPNVLYNHFDALQEKGLGSYNYRGNWNMLDQIITSGFTRPGNWKVQNPTIFREDWLMYERGTDVRPNRTYGGPNYYGGYSDHLPVFIEVYKAQE